jgi:glucose/mannose-6-phosphate isomerase
MRRLINQFTSQLTDALVVGNNAQLKPCNKKITSMVITGLGGSGIGGTIATQLVSDQIKIPAIINNDYKLPAFVNENTLVIVSSFSGNTEETLEALKIAQSVNAEIACITSGGKVAEIAKENNYNLIILPKAFSPRAMLTYSVVQQFFLFNHYGLINDSFSSEIKSTVSFLEKEVDDIKDFAHQTALALHSKTFVIYSESSIEGVAVRLRQQINENSKCLGWHHVVPEMNHNELVGWAGGKSEYTVLVLRSSHEYSRSKVRLDISTEIFKKYTPTVIEINAKGSSLIEQSFYHILLGDWISVYLAELNQVDDVEVKVIDYLKGELAKI